jgi:hypothetical protein
MNDFFIWCEIERDRLQTEFDATSATESRQSLAQRILELDILLFEANIILMPREPKGEKRSAHVIADAVEAGSFDAREIEED